MPLRGDVIATETVTRADIDRMYTLMRQYFTGVERTAFLADLTEKPWVILLRDAETGLLHGFSTLCLMEETVKGIPVRAFFSGDTIIDRPEDPAHSTGFLFQDATPAALAGTLRRALVEYGQPALWRVRQQSGMQQDFDWQRSAIAYAQIYQSLRKQP